MKIVGKMRVIGDLAEQLGHMELYRKIVELEEEIIILAREHEEQRAQIRLLEEQQDVRERMSFQAPFWYLDGDPMPFCARCWETDSRAVHLTGPSLLGQFYGCAECGTTYDPQGRAISRLRKGPSDVAAGSVASRNLRSS